MYRSRKKILLPDEIGNVNVRDYLSNEIGSAENGAIFNAANTSVPLIVNNNSGAGFASRGGSAAVEDLYFMLDSVDSIKPSSPGTIIFDISRLNNNNTVEGAVKLKLGSFYAPNILRPPNKPEYHYYKYVYLRINEFPSSQGVTIAPSKYFHFRLRVEQTNSSAIKLVPEDDTYYLTKPFTGLSLLSFSFIMPHDLRPMSILQDKISIVPVAGSTNIYEIVGDASTHDISPHSPLLTPYPITLDDEANNIVEVAGFISGLVHPDIDFNIAVNNPEGVIIKTIIDEKRFAIDLAAPFAWPGMTPTGQLIIAKNRVTIPIRITCSRSTPTNYLQPIQM